MQAAAWESIITALRASLHRTRRCRVYAQALEDSLKGLVCTLLIGPGRLHRGAGRGLVTRVLYVKRKGEKTFVVTDAAMNDLIRPALYQAHHEIVPVRLGQGRRRTVDIVGPVCEIGRVSP